MLQYKYLLKIKLKIHFYHYFTKNNPFNGHFDGQSDLFFLFYTSFLLF